MSKAKDFLSAIPPQAWLALGGVILAKGVWGDFTKGAKDLGKKTGEAFTEVERSKDALINLPEFQSSWFTKYTAGRKVKLLPQATVARIVDDLASAKGFFNDNEEKLYGALSACSTRSQLAQVAQAFNKSEGKNLGAYIVSFTNTNERHRIEKMIAKLPTGIL